MDKGLFLFCVENLSDYIKRILGASGFTAEEIMRNQREVGMWLGVAGRFAIDVKAALRAYDAANSYLARNQMARFCTYYSPFYPRLLKHSRQAPWGLFYEGEIDNDWERTLVAVGTRRPLPQSLRDAYRFGVECGLNGINIASGFAHGLDRAVMRGCLAGGGRTFGVLGYGLGFPYPGADAHLRRQILFGGGALISQFHPDAGGYRFNFPLRNHTLATLCRSVVAFQASARSGVLSTARWALDEGRDVYVHSSAAAGGRWFEGSRNLAEDGAPMVGSPADLFPGASESIRPVPYSPALERRPDGLFRIGNFWFRRD